MPNLRDYDIDEQSALNLLSRYFTLSELASVETNANETIILHPNIRSSSSYLDELVFCGQINKLVDIFGYLKLGTQYKTKPLPVYRY